MTMHASNLTAPALDIVGLRKSLGKAEIIRGIDLEVYKG